MSFQHRTFAALASAGAFTATAAQPSETPSAWITFLANCHLGGCEARIEVTGEHTALFAAPGDPFVALLVTHEHAGPIGRGFHEVAHLYPKPTVYPDGATNAVNSARAARSWSGLVT